ncbi:MAG: methionine--tRNA ligase [Nanoarchaeota archaeon]|nr:methionine--tRNA ligase [Nanoarchaeota archaeon]
MKFNKRILVTSALPYANGPIHIGHLVEYIQTDIFVRFLKLIGKDVIYCCADDTHGTPIQIKAEQLGITPEQLIADTYKDHFEDFTSFGVAFDSYYTTNSPENKAFADKIFLTLKEKGFIYTKDVENFYDLKAKRFLPDRYVKGECPKCTAKDQYGDVCEKCNATYKPTDLVNPYSTLTKETPVLKSSLHYFFKLSSLSNELKGWLNENKNLQPEIVNSVSQWINEGLQDWDISRDGPYFGFKIPGEENKYYYVWLDAPIGYIASTANYCKQHGRDAEKDYWKSEESTILHFIGKDIIYFHFLFWPAMLIAAGYKTPDSINVHGFLTVNGEKMSKSRGTFLTAKDFLKTHNPEYLRFYYAKALTTRLADINLDFKDFQETVNNELVANIGNFCYRVLSFLERNFDSSFQDIEEDETFAEIIKLAEQVKQDYESLNLKKAVQGILEISSLGNKFFQDNEPWKLVKEDRARAQRIVGSCVNIVKILSVLLSPILPVYAKGIQSQLDLQPEWKDVNFNLKNHRISKPRIILEKMDAKEESTIANAARTVHLKLDKEVQELGVQVAIAHINGVTVKKKHEGLERFKKTVKVCEDTSILSEYHEIDLKTGVDSSKYPNAVANLISLVKTKGKLPQINTAVDAYNTISLESGICMATHDADTLKGDIHVRLSRNETFLPLGGEKEQVPARELIYVDDEKVIGRFSKQCAQTATSSDSRNIVLVAFGNRAIPPDVFKQAVRRTCEVIVKFNGGTCPLLQEKPSFALNLRVGEIIEANPHPEADKLVVLSVSLGDQRRQIVAGIRAHYALEELKGKKIIVVTNLKPAKLRGLESQGMLLAGEEGGVLGVLTCDAPVGTSVGIEGFENSAAQIKYEEFQKVKLEVKNGKAFANGFQLNATGKEVVAERIKEGPVK